MFSRQSPKIRNLAATLSVLALSTAANAWQVSLDCESELRPNLGRAALQGPASPPLLLTGTSGEIFIEEADPIYVGWTFDYVNGAYVLKRPLFTVALSDQTGNPDSHAVRFTSHFGSSSNSYTNQRSFGVSGSLAVVRFATSYAEQHEHSSSMLTTSFSTLIEADYPRAQISTAAIPFASFVPEAQVILSISDPIQRTIAWKAAGFGRLVAIGYDLRGSVEMNFAMQDQSSFQSADRFFDASATYKGVTATAAFSSQMRETMRKQDLAYGLVATGCYVPQMPPLDELLTIDGQQAFANDLTTWSQGCKRRVGLYLVSASNLNNGPALDLPTWDDQLLADIGTAAENALDVLLRASRWNQSSGLRSFMSTHLRPQPQAQITFTAALDATRSELTDALESLRTAMFAYADPVNAGSLATRNAAHAAMGAVNQKAAALYDLTVEIRDVVNALPPIVATVTENFTPSGNGEGTAVWPTFNVSLDGIGFFRGSDDAAIEPFLAAFKATPIGTFHTLEVNEYLWNSSYCTRATSNGDIPIIDLLGFIPYSSGPLAGLSRMDFQFVSKLRSTSQWITFKLKDELGRAVVVNHDLSQ